MHARVYLKRALKLSAAVVSTLAPPSKTTPHDVVALMYHRVNAYRNNDMSVAPEKFTEQLRWLKESGYKNMRMSDLEAGSHDPGRRVILTFDDGYEDNYVNAFPILKEFGYTAMFYIPVNFVGSDKLERRDIQESNRLERNRRMTWQQLKELVAEGMEIGSHTNEPSEIDRDSTRGSQRRNNSIQAETGRRASDRHYFVLLPRWLLPWHSRIHRPRRGLPFRLHGIAWHDQWAFRDTPAGGAGQ